MDMKKEVLDEAMEEAFEVDREKEDSQELVSDVLAEAGLDMLGMGVGGHNVMDLEERFRGAEGVLKWVYYVMHGLHLGAASLHLDSADNETSCALMALAIMIKHRLLKIETCAILVQGENIVETNSTSVSFVNIHQYFIITR